MTLPRSSLALLLLAVSSLPAAAGGLLDPSTVFTSAPALAPLPGGDVVAIWHRDHSEPLPFGPDPCLSDALFGGSFTASGEPATPARPIGLPGGGAGGLPRLAATSSGDLALAWTSPGGLRVGRLTPELTVPAADLLSDCGIRGLALVAAGEGFWAVWSESCDGFRVRARRLDRRARPVSPALELSGPARLPGAGVAAAGGADGGLVTAWVEEDADGVRRVLGSRFRSDGAPATGPIALAPAVDVAGRNLAAAALPNGASVFAWRQDGAILLRRFEGDGSPAGAARRAGELDAGTEREPLLATTPGGLLVAAWARSPAEPASRCPLRVFEPTLEALTSEIPLAGDCDQPTSIAVPADGAPVVAWERLPDLAQTVCSEARIDAPDLEVLPPPVPPIVSSEYPGFRLWVRIGGGEPEPRIGSAEPLCLPETVCVSGALPGRIEVFLRVVGPKPNGFLWPTIVRFTTSTVEVWIEQTSTGTTRYYRLPGAAPAASASTGCSTARASGPNG